MIKSLKVLNQKTMINCQRFYLVQLKIKDITDDQRKYGISEIMYGTVPYEDEVFIKPKKSLLFFCAENTIEKAIERRKAVLSCEKMIKAMV